MKNAAKKSAAVRMSVLAVVGVLAFLATSCAPAPTTFNVGPLTVPLPPIGAAATPVDYVIDIPGIPAIELTPYIPAIELTPYVPPIELTPYIPPVQLTPYIPPVQLTPYIPPVCVPFVGCTPAVEATYSPAVPATYSPAVPATYSPEIPATYSPAIPATYSPAIPGGSCHAGYTPPAFFINGMTATLPLIAINPSAATVTIPNVTVNVPAANVVLGAGSVGCSVLGLPAVNLSTGDVSLTFPAQAVVQQATLNLATGVLTLSNPSFTVTGVGLHFADLDADFDLPDITIPLPTMTVPLT